MSSVQPISSAAISALIWELESNADAVFGASPIGASVVTPATPVPSGRRLYRAMSRLRTKTLPKVIASMNTEQTTFVRRTEVADPSDPLSIQFVSTTEDVYAYVFGASDQSLEKGFLSISDFEVIVAAHDLSAPLTERDAVRIDGKDHDIIGIIPYPKFPDPIAYRYLVKRAA